MLNEFLNKEILGNPIESYLWMFGILLFGFIIKKYGAKILSKQFYRVFKKISQSKQYSLEFVDLLKSPFELLLLAITLMLAFDRIEFHQHLALKLGKTTFLIEHIIIICGKIFLIISITWILLRCSDYIGFVLYQKAKEHDDNSDQQLTKFFRDVIKVIICIISFLIILGGVFGLDITSLITGLGIGGLAIALAAQETIANLIGSFVIFLDKPFIVGDLIEADKIKGIVEEVGFRSTKIRTLDKTLLTVPNKKLVDSALNNITRAGIRRVKVVLQLDGISNTILLKKFIEDCKSAIDQNSETAENYQVTLSDIIDNNIHVTIIYFVMTSDLNTTALIKEEINYKILELISKHQLKLSASIASANHDQALG